MGVEDIDRVERPIRSVGAPRGFGEIRDPPPSA
jgi:hypothetical protein